MNAPRHRFRPLCIAASALALAACAQGNVNGVPGAAVGGVAAPKSIIVSDFVAAPEVVAIDRGYTTRLERKVGQFPTFERKQRTIARVNDEIVASTVATLREAGLDAQPGNEDVLTLDQASMIVSGRLHPPADATETQLKAAGFGQGRCCVIASMTVASWNFGGKKQLLAFDVGAGKKRATPNAKVAAARNAAIAAALAAEDSGKVPLSPDVQAQARALGRDIGEAVLAFAREQGWIQKIDVVEEPEKKPSPKPVAARKPAPKTPKPAAEPAAEEPAQEQPAAPWPGTNN